jgi:hypothetical protein
MVLPARARSRRSRARRLHRCANLGATGEKNFVTFAMKLSQSVPPSRTARGWARSSFRRAGGACSGGYRRRGWQSRGGHRSLPRFVLQPQAPIMLGGRVKSYGPIVGPIARRAPVISPHLPSWRCAASQARQRPMRIGVERHDELLPAGGDQPLDRPGPS